MDWLQHTATTAVAAADVSADVLAETMMHGATMEMSPCWHCTQADIVLTFEDTWDVWLKEAKSSRRGRTAAGSSAATFETAVAVHGTGALSAADVAAQLRRARQLGYAYAYFTDAGVCILL